jgi:hypothetical protein
MQPIRLRALVLLIAVLAVDGATFAGGQNRSELVETKPSRTGNDPHVRSVFEGNNIAAFQLDIGPHESTLTHPHRHDYILIAITAGQFDAVGSSNSFPFEMSEGEMQVMKGNWPHRLVSRSDSRIRLIELDVLRGIEPEHAMCGLTGPPCEAIRFGATADGSYTMTVLFETPKVKLKRIEIGPNGLAPKNAISGEAVAVRLDHSCAGLIEAKNVPNCGVMVIRSPERLSNSGTEAAHYLVLETK